MTNVGVKMYCPGFSEVREKASQRFLIALSQPEYHQGGRIFFDVEFL